MSAQSDPGMGFAVTNKIGTLTIPSTGLGPNKYTIEVVDITSDKKYSEQGVFSIKAGMYYMYVGMRVGTTFW